MSMLDLVPQLAQYWVLGLVLLLLSLQIISILSKGEWVGVVHLASVAAVAMA